MSSVCRSCPAAFSFLFSEQVMNFGRVLGTLSSAKVLCFMTSHNFIFWNHQVRVLESANNVVLTGFD